jgi:hypothetical protein
VAGGMFAMRLGGAGQREKRKGGGRRGHVHMEVGEGGERGACRCGR